MPVGFVEGASCKHDMILRLFCSEYKGLSIVVHFNKLAVLSGDDSAGHAVLVFREHRDLNQHRCDVMDALKSLKIDRHVGWHETTLLLDFLLSGLFVVTIDTLGQELTESGTLEDFNEHLMRLLDHAQAEAGHTNLSDGSVVQNLIINMLQRNDLTNVSLLKEVSCADHLVVQGQVVYLQKGRLHTHFWLSM